MKEQKDEVHYSLGMLHSHCGPTFHDDKHYCVHFIPKTTHMGACERVEGKIDPIFWCDRFKKTK